MDALADKLIELGFTADAEAKGVAEANAVEHGMHENGPYVVHHVFTKGDVVVTIEQNTAPEDLGGMTAVVTHPPCAIIASPKGRVAFNPDDTDLAAALLDELG